MYKSKLALCSILIFLTGCQSDREVLTDLNEREANEILVFLDREGIYGYKKPEVKPVQGSKSWDIFVKAKDSIRAMRLIEEVGLPSRRIEQFLPYQEDAKFVSSKAKEHLKFQTSLGERLANTIRKIDGVIDCEVHLSLPNEIQKVHKKDSKRAAASVFIKHSGVLNKPGSYLSIKIKQFVASSVQGLSEADVTLIDENSEFRKAKDNQSKQWVSVWSMIIAKESLLRFRVIFMSMIATNLSLLWLLFKRYLKS